MKTHGPVRLLTVTVVTGVIALVLATFGVGRADRVAAGPYTTTFTFTNGTGQPAGFLHLQSNDTVGTLPSVNAPGCSAPAVFDSGFEYWEIVWPSPCVDPGESVSFEMSTFTVFYGHYWAPSVPFVSAVHPPGPPSDGLRIEAQAFVKGSQLVQNAPGCPPPSVSSGSAAVELTWSSACVDPGEKISVHIGAPGPVTDATFIWSPSGPIGGVSFDPTAGGAPSQRSGAELLAAALALSMCAIGGAALFARSRRIR